MSNKQAVLNTDAARFEYTSECAKPGYTSLGTPWYADTSREPIRDETLRHGLVRAGAAVERDGIPVTSPKPRYALERAFAMLFDPSLVGQPLDEAIDIWRSQNISKAGLARSEVVRAGRARSRGAVMLRLPNDEVKKLSPGLSSIITKHVVEEFAPRFLGNPAVVWISESGNKVVQADHTLAKTIGLEIDPQKNLPDVILADVAGSEIFLVFVEIVATDGHVSETRRKDLLALIAEAQFSERHAAFVTAYLDRTGTPLKRNLPDLAWSTFVWTASEPDNIIAMYGTEAAARGLRVLSATTYLRVVK